MGVESGSFSSKEVETLTTINLVISVFSFIGSAFIMFMYLKVKELRSFVFRCIFYLSISDVVYSFANMLADPADGSGLCYFQSLLITYFNIASVLWTTTIAHTLHRTMLLKNVSFHSDSLNDLMKYYHGICWGLPFILTILPFTTNSYGDSGGWCWIKNNDHADTAWRMITFYVPLWLCVIYNAYVYIKVLQVIQQFREVAEADDNRPPQEEHLDPQDLSLNDHPNNNSVIEPKRVISDEVPGDLETTGQRFRTLDRVRYYPLVLIVCYFFATVNRINELAADSVFWLSVLHTIGAALQGLLNAIVYGLTPAVREAFLDLLSNSSLEPYCGCLLRQRSSTISQLSAHRDQTVELTNSGRESDFKNVDLNDD